MKNSILFKKGRKAARETLGLLLLLFALFFTSNKSVAQCTLVVNGPYIASVDQTCQAEITHDALLTDPNTCPGATFTVEIYDNNLPVASGNPAIIPSTYLGMTLQGRVKAVQGMTTNYSNWVDIDVVDEIAPTIGCYQPIDSFDGTLAATDGSYIRTSSAGPTVAPACFAGATTVYYNVFEFTIDKAGAYSFLLDGSQALTTQFFAALYIDGFDPNDPCQNFLYDDFAPAIGGNITIPVTLTDLNTNYFLVTTTVGAGQTGDYTWTVTPPATGGRVLGVVPNCEYELFCYEKVDEEVVIIGRDNCDLTPTIGTPGSTPNNNDCSGALSPDILYVIDKIYEATDDFGKKSPQLPVKITVKAVPQTVFNSNIHWPGNLTFANAIECNTAGAFDMNGYPLVSYTGAPELITNGDTMKLNVSSNACQLYASTNIFMETGNSCGKDIIRKWTVASSGYCTTPALMDSRFQTITVQDTEGPDFDCPMPEVITTNASVYFNSTVNGITECGASYLFPAPVAPSDNCQLQQNLKWSINVVNDNQSVFSVQDKALTATVMTNLPFGINTIEYIVSDGCSNLTNCFFTVTVEDQTAPIAVVQQNTVVGLSYFNEVDVPAINFDSGSFDDCQLDSILVKRADAPASAPFREFVTFDCADIPDANSPMVLVKVIDKAGNSSVVMVSVDVQDKLLPILTPPLDRQENCEFFYEADSLAKYFGGAQCHDNCTFTLTEGTAKTEVFNCWGIGPNNMNEPVNMIRKITRYFTATDGNNTVQDSQVIRIVKENHFGFVGNVKGLGDANGAIVWPKDTTFFMCMDPDQPIQSTSPLHPNQSGRPQITETGCDEVGSMSEDFVFVDNDNNLDNNVACFKIIRTWTVLDNCHKDKDGKFERWSHDQTLFVKNTVGPTLQAIPDTTVCSMDTSCTESFISLRYGVTDDCTQLEDLRYACYIDYGNNNAPGVYDKIIGPSAVLVNDSLDASGKFPYGVHRLRWIVWDQCGNKTTREQILTHNNCKKPTPMAKQINTDLTLMNGVPMVMVPAYKFDAGSSHVCNYDLVFAYDAQGTELVRTYTCDSLGLRNVPFWVLAYDNGNFISSDLGWTTVSIQDNSVVGGLCPPLPLPYVNVSGMITNEFDQPVTNVAIALEGSEFNDAISDQSGAYAFPDMLGGGNYNVVPHENADHANGVSTLDLILVQKHLMGLKNIESPYKMIAADVNNDQKISASDLLDTRELILGVSQEFPNNTSWRFVNASYVFENEANPITEAFLESATINNIQEDTQSDFIAIKVGDITNDASLDGREIVEPRSNRTLKLDLDTRKITEGMIDVPVYANDFNRINGLQFTLNYDPSVLIFKGIGTGALNLNMNNFYHVADGIITVSWSQATAIDLADQVELFSLIFDASGKAELQNVIRIGSELTRAEAYDAELNKLDLELNYRNLDSEGEFALYQNIPNPFSENTQISFFMKEAGFASISIHDLNGKLVRKFEGNFSKGINTITVDKEDLSVNGLLYYQMNTDGYSATKKMILIK